MDLSSLLTMLVGQWAGTNALWFMPTDPGFHSTTTAEVRATAEGAATLIEYTWSHEGTPHAGVMVILHTVTPGKDALTWVDSFHTEKGFMHFRGDMKDGALVVLGSYGPPDAPWGWRIELTAPETDRMEIRMFNILPDGQEALAVESLWRRVP